MKWLWNIWKSLKGGQPSDDDTVEDLPAIYCKVCNEKLINKYSKDFPYRYCEPHYRIYLDPVIGYEIIKYNDWSIHIDKKYANIFHSYKFIECMPRFELTREVAKEWMEKLRKAEIYAVFK